MSTLLQAVRSKVLQIGRAMSTVYVTRKVPPSGVNALKSAGVAIRQWDHEEPIPRDRLLANVKGVDGIFCCLTEKIDAEVLDSCGPQLKVLGTMSVGYDHVDVAECKRRNVRVGFTPGVLTHATAELTVALLLATSRRLQEGITAVKDGSWGTWDPLWLCGPSLQNTTIGIFGFGRIGQKVAQFLSGFETKEIIYCDHTDQQVPNNRKVSFDELLSTSDYIICSCSLTAETRNIFNKDTFKRMKASAILINTSRGPVVNMEDLADALESRVISAAGLDVTVPEPLPLDSRLQQLDNCVVLPHIASATVETRSAMSLLTGQNILAVFENKEMPAEVKMPSND